MRAAVVPTRAVLRAATPPIAQPFAMGAAEREDVATGDNETCFSKASLRTNSCSA